MFVPGVRNVLCLNNCCGGTTWGNVSLTLVAIREVNTRLSAARDRL